MTVNRAQLAKEVKRANTRLVALEKKGLADTSRAYQYVFSEMPNRYGLTSVSKTGHLKFVTALKKLSDSDLKTLHAEVKNFLGAQTSTVTGAKKAQQKRKENFRKQFGDDTYKRYEQDKTYKKFFDNMLNSEHLVWATSTFGSEQTVQIVKEYGIEFAEKVFMMAYKSKAETIMELYEIIEDLQRD